MRKQYAKGQIVEAIRYWKKQLAEGNYVNETDNDEEDGGDEGGKSVKSNPAETFLKGAVKKFKDKKVDPKNWQKLDDLFWEEMQGFVKEYGSMYGIKLKTFAVDVDKTWMKLYDEGGFSRDEMFMALGDSTRQMIVKAGKA